MATRSAKIDQKADLIWAIADKLTGVYKPHEYGDVILPLTVIRRLVHKGDFAMNHMDLLTGWVDISKYEGVTSPDYRVFVLNDKNGMCPKYYLYMMQMCYSARIFYGLGQGVSGMGRWRLQADKFLNFYIPIPPYDEQKKIADYITDKVNHIEVEIDKRNKPY